MHVLPKTQRFYAAMEAKHGIVTHFYIDDSSGLNRKIFGDSNPNIHYAKDANNRLLAWVCHWLGFLGLLWRLHPNLIEVYTSRHPALTLPMVLLAKIFRIPVVVTCRGELYYFEKRPNVKRSSFFVRWAFSKILRMANLVVYKETYMLRLLKKICPCTPKFFWYNAIPLGPKPNYHRDENLVLFLNRLLPERNLDLLVRAAAIVCRIVPSAIFAIVGKTGGIVPRRVRKNTADEYDAAIDHMIDELSLRDVVKTYPFSTEPEKFYTRAKVYVFPADHVFCNNALLEAMERGVPPIVSDEKDREARRMVENGISGLIVPLDEHAIADAIVKLLTQEDLRLKLARGARQKISEEYDLYMNLKKLAKKYQELIEKKL